MKNTVLNIDNLPAPKDEAWKYTNISRFVPKTLRDAGASEPITITKERGKVCEHIEDIIFIGEADTYQEHTLKIKLEEGAQLTLLERHVGEGSYWKNVSIDVELGANAHFHHVRLLEDDTQGLTTIKTNVSQERDSTYYAYTLNMGGAMVRCETHSILNGAGAHCDLAGINLMDGKRHGDTTILIEHAAPHCTSSQLFRHVLDDASRCVFQGKVHVHKIAQKTDGYQLSNTLLLSEKAEMDTKPELEIYADDVKCSHGTTVGQLDDEPLFYLRSRGLTKAEARLLLIEAFLDEVSEKIKDEGLRARVQGLSRTWLGNVLQK